MTRSFVLPATFSRHLILLFLTIAVFLTFTGESSALYAVMYDGTSVTLHWTAPGDDGDIGLASVYDLRCSIENCGLDSASWWNAAVSVPGLPSPSRAGSTESFTVNGLEDGMVYYFAIRAADEAGNWSAVSNIYSTAYYDCADANGDGDINLLDIVFILNYLYRGGPDPEFPENCDTNGDGVINVLDDVYLISYLYKNGPEPHCDK